MRRNSLYISAGIHVAAIVVTLVGLPFIKKDFEIPPPISVEFAEIDKITQTTKVAPKPAPKQEDKKEATPPAAKAAAKNDSAEPVKPKPEKAEKDEKPEPKKEEIAKEEIPDKKKTPEKKKKEEKKEEKEKPKDFSSVLKNLAEPKPPTPPTDTPDMKTDEAAAAEGSNATLGPKMTMSEEDALRRQLERCWNVPIGAKDAANLQVEIFMVINPDRTLRSAKIVDTARAQRDPFFRSAAESALRAVHSPLCSPFMLPADKYDTWKNTTVTFDPSQMF
jgi:outer membrane biosynthesis protein TonB